jgi:tetratricopeptide (TPR) repeat protein
MKERIDNYILGRMFNEERQAFEKEMSVNSELQEKVALHRDIVRAMRIERDKEYLQSLERDIKMQKMTERRRRTFAMRISSIAVAACLVLGVFVHFDTQSDYRQYGLGIELAISRGGGYSDKAAVAINEGHYDEALSLIAEGEAQPFVCDDTNPEIVEAERNEYYREQDELQWYKTVAYMRMGKYIKAKRLLKQIASSDSEYKDEAQAALDAL